MKLHLFPLLISTSVLLTACGGGSGDGNSTSPVVSSNASSLAASSSSAASSTAPELGCAYHEAGVYINAACSPWQNPSAREKNADGSAGQEVDAKQSQYLSLTELEDSSATHQRILDIHYNQAGATNAQLGFSAAGTTGIDLSTYQTGKLVFDLKVISKGDKNASLQVTLDCGWPCESTERNIEIGTLNEWKTIELPIADFIRDGLDIKKVRSGFQIMPSVNQQTNVHFQLDNIRWEKGQSTQPVTESCYSRHFDSTTNGLNLRSFSGNKLPSLVGQIPASIIKPEWSSPQERWGYGEQILNPNDACLNNPASTFSASVYIPGAYVTDGKLLVGFYFADAENNYTTAGLTSAANLLPDTWNIIQGKLPQTQNKTRGLSTKLAANQTNFSHWGILFDANGKDPAVTGEVRIDNILISQNLIASSSSTSQTASSANTSLVTASSSSVSQASSSAISSSLSSIVATPSSSSSLGSSKSSVQSSAVASSICNAGSGSHSGSATLGFGISLNSLAYLRVELDNSKFVGSPNISIPNASLTTVMSNDSMVILQITPSQFLSSSTLVSLNFDYQQQDAQLKVARSVTLHTSLSDAANRANILFSSSADIAAPCSLSSRASSSQTSASTISSSSSVATSRSSSSQTSVASSSTSSSSVVASSSSSNSSSSAGCSAASGSHSGSVPLGFGFPASSTAFLRIDLTNGTFTSDPVINISGATYLVAQSSSSRIIYSVHIGSATSSSTPVGISQSYQQQNPLQKVVCTVTLYSTSPDAVNRANWLASSSLDIASPACP